MRFMCKMGLLREACNCSTSQAWDVLQLQASRSKPILHMNRMAAENPVWLVCAQKIPAPQRVKLEKPDA